jgi:hypothetical protein
MRHPVAGIFAQRVVIFIIFGKNNKLQLPTQLQLISHKHFQKLFHHS